MRRWSAGEGPTPAAATPLSQIARAFRRQCGAALALNGHLRVWHVACNLVWATGCPYLEPVWQDVNHRPEILNPADFVPSRTIERKLRSPVDNFLVRAWDEDDDQLLFLWEDPSGANDVLDLPDQAGPPRIQASQLRLAWDASLDGRTVNCQVFDGENAITVRWRIVLDGSANDATPDEQRNADTGANWEEAP